MKATKDKNGTVSWEQEPLNEEALFSGKPVEKIVDKPGLLDKLKEKAKTLPQDDETESL